MPRRKSVRTAINALSQLTIAIVPASSGDRRRGLSDFVGCIAVGVMG